MPSRRCQGKTLTERDRVRCLDACSSQHPCGAGQVGRQLRAKLPDNPICCIATMPTFDPVVHLDEVDPADDRPVADRDGYAACRRLIAVKPGEHGPRVQTNAHRGSEARSSSSCWAIPLPPKMPASDASSRSCATKTTSPSRNSKSTWSPGRIPAWSRTLFGMTTCPLSPTRTLILRKYDSGRCSRQSTQRLARRSCWWMA
jgi:hypothetical protein